VFRLAAAIAILAVAALVLVVAVFLVTGLLAGWGLWLLIGWWFFGRHGRSWRPPRIPRSYRGRGVYGPRRVF
jgi:hypothetical protein